METLPLHGSKVSTCLIQGGREKAELRDCGVIIWRKSGRKNTYLIWDTNHRNNIFIAKIGNKIAKSLYDEVPDSQDVRNLIWKLTVFLFGMYILEG